MERMIWDREKQEQDRIASIINTVNEHAGLKLILKKKLESFNLHCTDQVGRQYVITCDFSSIGFTVKTLLKRHGHKKMNWSINGQAGTGCTAIQTWMEPFVIPDPHPTPRYV